MWVKQINLEKNVSPVVVGVNPIALITQYAYPESYSSCQETVSNLQSDIETNRDVVEEELTHCDVITPYGVGMFCRHWFR